MQPVMVMHPFKPEFMASQADFKDPDGVLFVEVR